VFLSCKCCSAFIWAGSPDRVLPTVHRIKKLSSHNNNNNNNNDDDDDDGDNNSKQKTNRRMEKTA
jgi:hypothetical protein